MYKKILFTLTILSCNFLSAKELATQQEIQQLEQFLKNGKNYLLVDAKQKNGKPYDNIVIHGYRIQNGSKLFFKNWKNLTKKEKIFWTHANIKHQDWVYAIEN